MPSRLSMLPLSASGRIKPGFYLAVSTAQLTRWLKEAARCISDQTAYQVQIDEANCVAHLFR